MKKKFDLFALDIKFNNNNKKKMSYRYSIASGGHSMVKIVQLALK